MQAQSLEEYAKQIAVMPRPHLIAMLRGLDCDFKLDFTDEFMASVSLERLRHITMAALLHAHSPPNLSV